MKRGWMRGFLFLALIMVLALQGPAVVQRTQAATKEGLVQKSGKYYYYVNGKKVKNRWVDIGSKRYYFQKNGAAAVGLLQYGEDYYAFNEKGVMLHSKKVKIYKVGKYYYSPQADGKLRHDQFIYKGGKLYFVRGNGRVVTNMTVKGVTFNSKGVAQPSISTTSKIGCIETVNALTKSSWSKERKLKACWDYLTGPDFSYVLRYDANRDDKTWMKRKAIEMLNSHGGDCVSYACAFAGLASACGYHPDVIYGRVPGTRDQAPDGFTTHCWVLIDHCYYDPEGQAAGWNKNCYGVPKYPFAFQVHHIYGYDTGNIAV